MVSLGIKAHVRNGRIVADEPTDLPEGTELEVAIVDMEDDLDDEDRARLHAALDQSDREFEAGLGIPAEQVLKELRALRTGR